MQLRLQREQARRDEERYSHNGRKKHNRRCADKIQKSTECPYDDCKKRYGCEGSMNLHIKIKHNGGNKTNREQSARELVFLKSLGKKINLLEVTKGFNLPPGIVYTAVKQLKELEQEVTISDAELG